VTCVCHQQIVKTATVQAEPAGLAARLLRWFPGPRCTRHTRRVFSLRAAPRPHHSGDHSHRRQSCVIAVAAHDKVKTDRRDAKRLAIDLADGRLRGLSIPTEAEERARLLPRTRAQIVEHRATIAARSKPSCTSLV